MSRTTLIEPGSGEHRVLDFNHDGQVSRGELVLAVVLGGAAFIGAVGLGALLVLWACG